MDWEKYRGRKFLIVCMVLILSFGMAYDSSLSSQLSVIYMAAVASYGVANAWNPSVDSDYTSRKFVITLFVLIASTITEKFGFLTPELGNVVSAAIGSYNLTQGWVDRGKTE